MSTAIDTSSDDSLGFPELTSLGKQIEVLRIGRGLSKQHLARYAATSRQQLWRVMTGKTELTGALRQRLADALRVHESVLGDAASQASSSSGSTSTAALSAGLPPWTPSEPVELEVYLAQPAHVERTLRSLPNGEQGRELKRTLLNALEDTALERGVSLPSEFFDLRRRVLSGDI
jgi:transcriptional regulator with XRE-family HTH domain